MSLPDNWDDEEKDMFADFTDLNAQLADDDFAMVLFHEGYFDLDQSPEDRDEYVDALREWLWDEYGIEFDSVFDWAEYAEWYDAATA